MTDFQKKIFGIIVLATVGVLAVATLVAPKKTYSEAENRYLKTLPGISFDKIKDGSFMEDIEDYASDHFVLRDAFMTARTKYELITGRNNVNGIYVCADDYYIEEYKEPVNTDRIERALKRLMTGISGAKLHVMIVPTAVTVYADKLPATAKNASQLDELNELTAFVYKEKQTEQTVCEFDIVDVTDALMDNKDSKQLFYRLDHHWTTDGAYLGYCEYCKVAGLTPAPEEAFEKETVTDAFCGTFHSKLNDPTAKPDSITAYYSKNAEYEVVYRDNKKESTADSPYSEKYLEGKDKYSFFLDNQHAMAEIRNKNAASDKAIVLIKDSYANCMIPFLAENYSTVYVFDTRYYTDSVTDFINAHEEVSDVLFLYNLYTLDTDTGIAGIK